MQPAWGPTVSRHPMTTSWTAWGSIENAEDPDPTYAAERSIVLSGYDEDTVAVPGTGLHASSTVDVVLVAEGEVVLMLEDGAEVSLHEGDWVVQDQAVHRWANRSSTTCRLVITMVAKSGVLNR